MPLFARLLESRSCNFAKSSYGSVLKELSENSENYVYSHAEL